MTNLKSEGFLKNELKTISLIIIVFLACFYLPIESLQNSVRVRNSFWEGLHLVRWYAREHVLLCLVPAFFIAGAISSFMNRRSVMKYLGPMAPKSLAYGVASISGAILSVCSCTVLPMFSGIYKMGAGLGPATAFLYSGPAISVLAIVFTAAVLGPSLGVARGAGAIIFSVIIGVLMSLIFRKSETDRINGYSTAAADEKIRPIWQTAVFFISLIGILVFANWGKPKQLGGTWEMIYNAKWLLTSAFALALGVILVIWFQIRLWKVASAAAAVLLISLLFPSEPSVSFIIGVIALTIIAASQKGDLREWLDQTWSFAKQILPLLLGGVLIAGFLLGRPGQEGLIPSGWIENAVGGNSILANFFAAFAGAFMYFATLTEVPIVQGLLGAGMGKGPALALLLAGPALSLPSMLVIRSILGTRKTIVYITIVIIISTLSGIIYGLLL